MSLNYMSTLLINNQCKTIKNRRDIINTTQTVQNIAQKQDSLIVFTNRSFGGFWKPVSTQLCYCIRLRLKRLKGKTTVVYIIIWFLNSFKTTVEVIV